ncbi:MAG TPA: Lrp/AsnC family transcriptional regulator [Salinarimonas sp.]|jgi:Lrp/AsnC family transcriptional regulator|nr:Lrp/AsnC family transcriptional regulator [Salinarimonas sp.]
MANEIDSFDRRILNVLQSDASITTTSLADRVGLSQAPCWRRIKRLEEMGVIRGRVTLLDRRQIGLNVMIFTHVRLQTHGRQTLPDFEEAIRRYPEVLECYTLLGETDYLLKIVVPDVEAYERFFREHLSQMPAVRETNSSIVLSEIKVKTELPLSLAP